MEESQAARFPRAWGEPRPAPEPPRKWTARRRLQLLVALVGFVGVGGLIAGMVAWHRPLVSPYFVPLWLIDFESPLIAHHSWLHADRAEMIQSGIFTAMPASNAADQSKARVLRDLADLAELGSDRELVVYLAALARAGADESLLILPGDANPDDRSTWLPLQSVLESIQRCPAKRKLLVLDLWKPPSDLRLGLDAGDIATLVASELARTPDPTRLVLTSHGPGQEPLESLILGRSVFNYYLHEGLLGWADLATEETLRDGRVSVQDLARFVTARVDRWATRNQGKRQTPVLSGTGRDFELAAPSHGVPLEHVATRVDLKTTEPLQRPLFRLFRDRAAKATSVATDPAAAAKATASNASASKTPPAEKTSGDKPPSTAVAKNGASAGATGPGAPTAGAPSAPGAPSASDPKSAVAAKSSAPSDVPAVAARADSANNDQVQPPEYPDELEAAWKLRQDWWDHEVYRAAPRQFRQLETDLLWFEDHWATGAPIDALRIELSTRLARYRREMERLTNIPRPQPRSLALAAVMGAKPDPAAAAELKTLLKKWSDQIASAKPEDVAKIESALADEFATKMKGKDAYSVGRAVIDELADAGNPSAALVRVLQRFASVHDPRPEYFETWWLEQLADLAARLDANKWPAPVVRASVLAANAVEVVASERQTLAWMKDFLDDAYQSIHEGQILLLATEYADLSEAAETLRRGSVLTAGLRRFQTTILEGHRQVDRAFAMLPALPSFVESEPTSRRAWQEAASSAHLLMGGLRPAVGSVRKNPLALRKALQEGEESTRRLSDNLDSLLRHFDEAAITALIEHANDEAAAPELVVAMRELLETPMLSPGDRRRLWQARIDLERRFAAATIQVDRNDEQQRLGIPGVTRDDASERIKRDRRESAIAANAAIDLLKLAGIEPDEIASLETKLSACQQNPDATDSWVELSDAVRRGWAESIPKLLNSNGPLPKLAAAAKIAAPRESLAYLDQPARNPIYQLRSQEETALWDYLAGTYRTLGRDSPDRDFFFTAASAYAPKLAFERPYALFRWDVQSVSSSNGGPAIDGVLTVEIAASPDSKLQVPELSILTADSVWLDISADSSGLAQLAEPARAPTRQAAVPIRIRMKPGAESSDTPAPRGFVVRVTVEGRVFNLAVDLPDPSPLAGERVDAWFATDLKRTKPPLKVLLLRPLANPQEYFLFIENKSSRQLNAAVELYSDGAALGPQVKIAVAPRSSAPVTFGKEAPKPGTPLPEFKGPLTIRILDADHALALIKEIAVPVEIASAREYVRLGTLAFKPADERRKQPNRLTVELASSTALAGPPPTVQMSLTPDRIPGFVAVKRGTLRGTVVPGGAPFSLVAEDIVLNPAAEEDGLVQVGVDGDERAFLIRTTFSRWGSPTTPELSDRPGLSIVAPAVVPSSADVPYTIVVDGAFDESKVEVALGKMSAGSFVPERSASFPQARERRIGFSPVGPSGGLAFQADVRDWKSSFDAVGIAGQRMLVARLVGAGSVLLDEAKHAILFDDRPPSEARFIDLPATALQGTTIEAKALANASQSPIESADFFLGVPAQGKPPAGAALTSGHSLDAKKTVWSARVPLPPQKGPVDLSVQFKNAAGLTSFASAQVTLTDVPAAGAIRVTVLEADRPQPELEITLADAKGKEVLKGKTGRDGTFLFTPLPPGAYTAKCEKPATGRKASGTATVESGKTTQLMLPLRLQP